MNITENDPGQGGKFFTSGKSTQYGIIETPRCNKPSSREQAPPWKSQHLTDWFVSVSILNLITMVGVSLFRLVMVLQENPESPEFAFNVVLLNISAFCVFYVIYGIVRKKSYELYVFIVAVLIGLSYCIIEYTFLNTEGRTVDKLIRIISGCILSPPNIYLACSVARNFNISEDVQSRHVTRRIELYSVLLKFDLLVTSSFVLLALKEGTSLDILEQVSLGVGIPYTFLWGLLGWFMLRIQIKCIVWLFFIYGLSKPTYYIFTILKVCIHLSQNKDLNTKIISYSSLVFGALCLLVWLILMLELSAVYQSFGKGLRDRVVEKIPDEGSRLLDGDQS